MRIRKDFNLYRFLNDSDVRWIWEGVKTAFSLGKWWYKNTDEWRKWIARVILVRTFIGFPALGVAVVGSILLSQYNVPPYGQLGAISSGYPAIYFVSALFFLFLETYRPLNRWLERRVDLEVPIYVCIRKHCSGNLLYHQVEKLGRICPYCKGEVRLLSAEEKRRQPRWSYMGR
jgi:hypothetical protein